MTVANMLMEGGGRDPRIARRRLVLSGLALSVLVTAVAALCLGSYPIAPGAVLNALMNGEAGQGSLVIMEIRLPRVLFGMLVGAALGGSGASMQALFRNPLADPGLIGISAGAALGAVSIIVLGATLAPAFMEAASTYAIPIAAFVGAALATGVIVVVGTKDGRVDVALMLLTGIAVNAVAGAGIGVMTFIADDQELRTLTFWTMGSLAIAGWSVLPILIPAILAPIAVFWLSAPNLNRFLLGEVEAGHLGVNVKSLKRVIVLGVALSVGAAVSFAGAIGFVGLVVPHLVRLIAGPDNRVVLPGAVMLGAVLMVGADVLARTVIAPAELPVGLVLSAVGGPFFLWLLLNTRWRAG